MMVADFFAQLGPLLALEPLLLLAATVLLGIVFGALPGLTATLGVALLTAVTFSLTAAADPAVALQYSMIALLGVYVGAIYGGSHPAILLNIPGTGAAAATALEGYPLSLQGRSGETIGMATVMSFRRYGVGRRGDALPDPSCCCGWRWSSPRSSITFCWPCSGADLRLAHLPDLPSKGWIAGILGLLIATVGEAPLQAYARFTSACRSCATASGRFR